MCTRAMSIDIAIVSTEIGEAVKPNLSVFTYLQL